jgi:hypothetical protein
VHRTARRSLLGLALLALAPGAESARGQAPGTRVVVPDSSYAAHGLKETLLGDSYRDQWTSPMRVKVLDLGGYAGGLEPTKTGGGLQTKSLRFDGADGKEYAFRSLDKYPDLSREPALHGTVIGEVIQDQTSSLHIGGQLAVPVMLDALGVIHATPDLFVIPDDPRLGEFRQQFAGMIGTVEEHINDQEKETPGFGGFRRILDTEDLFERLEESPADRIDARSYLKARLFDLVINDWDRHEDQWRWAAVDSAGVRWWVAIPRDRDYAFVDYDGVAMSMARHFARNTVEFTPEIHNVYGLTLNARRIDRRLLSGLDRAAWDSVTAFVQARLTDEVIDRAMRRMPLEVQALSGDWTAARLRSRRDDLRNAASTFYELLASDVEIHATDKRDVAVVDRAPDGSLLVRLYDADRDGQPHGEPYFQRRFVRDETIEVRIFLHGGDDHAIVRGTAPVGLTVRVIGGGGDDLLEDSSRLRKGKTDFYDDRGDNRFVRGPVTRVDEKPFEAPENVHSLGGETARDYGSGESLGPALGWRGEDGPIVGARWTHTRYGFRKLPYAWLVSAAGQVGTLSGALAADLFGDVRRQNSLGGYSAHLRASQLESIRFYGFGNETRALEESRFYLVRRDELLAQATYHLDLPWRGVLSVGPVAKLGKNETPAGTPFTAGGVGEEITAQLGGRAEVSIDRRDEAVFPRNGVRAAVGGAGYPVVGEENGPFGEVHALASAYWTAGGASAPTVAVRAGAKKLWGDYPVHEAAFLGGSGTLRGYVSNRYAGDAETYGSVELRQPVGLANLRLVRATVGLLLLADGGRVYYHDESSDAWHGALGGGVWLHFRIRTTPLGASATFARGESSALYLKLGVPF